VLPSSIRPQIGLAYLLARTTDTIADTELVPLDQRLSALQTLRERILGASTTRADFGRLAEQQSSPAERVLLEQCEASLALLRTLTQRDLELVRAVLGTILSGQELDLRRFAGASIEHIAALRTRDELDDYTYRVAGCVGEFWTKVCRAHVFPSADLDDASLLANSVRFGKGLQLVNILRDLPTDLRLGRCYLPFEELEGLGMTPQELIDPTMEDRLRPLYNSWLAKAEAHLLAGWDYTNALPRRSVRVRLACAWPILIGLRTLSLLAEGIVLDPRSRIKVSRGEVRKWMRRSVLLYPWPGAWKGLAEEARRRKSKIQDFCK
jgi:farnesyl-diphosphate farnesyltransferase